MHYQNVKSSKLLIWAVCRACAPVEHTRTRSHTHTHTHTHTSTYSHTSTYYCLAEKELPSWGENGYHSSAFLHAPGEVQRSWLLPNSSLPTLVVEESPHASAHTGQNYHLPQGTVLSGKRKDQTISKIRPYKHRDRIALGPKADHHSQSTYHLRLVNGSATQSGDLAWG